MSKIIIGIHGLGNKPPKQNLSDLWQKNIIWCLEKYNYSKFNFDFELVYWADILHPVPLNPEDYVPILDKNESLSGKTQFLSELPELRIKAKEYLEKFYGKILVNEVLSLKYPSFTDLFIHLNMRDLEKDSISGKRHPLHL